MYQSWLFFLAISSQQPVLSELVWICWNFESWLHGWHIWSAMENSSKILGHAPHPQGIGLLLALFFQCNMDDDANGLLLGVLFEAGQANGSQPGCKHLHAGQVAALLQLLPILVGEVWAQSFEGNAIGGWHFRTIDSLSYLGHGVLDFVLGIICQGG